MYQNCLDWQSLVVLSYSILIFIFNLFINEAIAIAEKIPQ
ncbi:hypothetical protein AsAng_0032620 [Aureispira anguillae]|uniref:Uncharacterized protein n=1 Tax=Aureispira anguillae TaxID=2864201 RepID=A0A915YG55_9BACT|nr:hypothetical protein AsAng_0032620 [Aureispira anguillae]